MAASSNPAFPPKPPTTARLFFAIWPDGKTRDLLDAAARKLHAACGGRRTRRETIHITLAFLGEVPVERIIELRALAGQISAAPFELLIANLGWWRHNRIAWAAPQEVPAAMAELAGSLANRLKEKGFRVEERPYLPHATLARKAHCRELPVLDEAIVWPVTEFVLVRSAGNQNGAAYEVIGRWPFMPVELAS